MTPSLPHWAQPTGEVPWWRKTITDFAYADPDAPTPAEAKAALVMANANRRKLADALCAADYQKGRADDAEADRDALRAQVRQLQDELGWARDVEAEDTSDSVWREREAA